LIGAERGQVAGLVRRGETRLGSLAEDAAHARVRILQIGTGVAFELQHRIPVEAEVGHASRGDIEVQERRLPDCLADRVGLAGRNSTACAGLGAFGTKPAGAVTGLVEYRLQPDRLTLA